MYEERTTACSKLDTPRLGTNYESILEEIHITLGCMEEKLYPVMTACPENGLDECKETRQIDQLRGLLRRIKFINDSIYL